MTKVYPVRFDLQGQLNIKAKSVEEAYEIADKIISKRRNNPNFMYHLDTYINDLDESDAVDASEWRENDLDKFEGGE